MKLLFISSECAPFVKTGGLADVIGALPKALAAKGVEVKILLPGYRQLAKLIRSGEVKLKIRNLFGGPTRIISTQSEGLDLLILDAPHLFDRVGNIYQDEKGDDWADNHLRFGALSFIGAKIGLEGISTWRPDIVNAHDWQAGLVAAYMHQSPRKAPPCVLTIHNIAFQGLFEAKVRQKLGLDEKLFTSQGIEFFGKIGFLKAGIAYSQKITTVSPTYAWELMLPEYGMGLEGLLNARQKDFCGILNGIDLDIWNPQTDELLVANYSAKSLKGKQKNRAEIEKIFNLTPKTDCPIFCVISRLTTQKGLDLLLEAIPVLVRNGGRLALLGTGEKWIEKGFVDAAVRYKGEVGVIIGYDEKLSHLMQGGSDAILIPSRFEPCGLTQLYGLCYGTLPVVSRTGGLSDTVIDANEVALSSNCATGIQFSPVTLPALIQAIVKTCQLYKNKETWTKMMRRAMGQAVGWENSGERYYQLYKKMLPASSGKSR